MILSKEDGAYHLTIEIPTPIEFVLLQSDVPVKLLDVDKSTAVVSFSPCEPMVRPEKCKYPSTKHNITHQLSAERQPTVGHLSLSGAHQSRRFAPSHRRRTPRHVAGLRDAQFATESVAGASLHVASAVDAHARPCRRRHAALQYANAARCVQSRRNAQLAGPMCARTAAENPSRRGAVVGHSGSWA